MKTEQEIKDRLEQCEEHIHYDTEGSTPLWLLEERNVLRWILDMGEGE
jgi:hypothetical protein